MKHPAQKNCSTQGVKKIIEQVGKRKFSDLLSFPFLSHHRTCRSAYGGSVLYTYCVELSRFCTHSAKRHFFPIFGIRPIVLGREFLFGHLATKDAEHISSWQRPRTVRSFAMYCTNTATSTSADFLTLVVTILKGLSRPHGISLISFIVYLPNLRIKVTVAFWNFTVLCLLVRLIRLSIRFLFVRPRIRYCFFSPKRHRLKLASRQRVRRQLRPEWTFTTDI